MEKHSPIVPGCCSGAMELVRGEAQAIVHDGCSGAMEPVLSDHGEAQAIVHDHTCVCVTLLVVNSDILTFSENQSVS